jgi:hypothetical protein
MLKRLLVRGETSRRADDNIESIQNVAFLANEVRAARLYVWYTYLKRTVCRQHRLRPPQRSLHAAHILHSRPTPQACSYHLPMFSEQVQHDVGELNLQFGKCGLARGRLPIRSGPNLAPTSLGAARVQIPQIPRTMLTKRMRLPAGMWRCQVHRCGV